MRQISPIFGTPQAAELEQRIHDLEQRVALIEMRLAALAGQGREQGNDREKPDGHGPARAGSDGARFQGHGPRPLVSWQYDAANTAARAALAAARASAAARSAWAAARFVQARGMTVSLREPQPEQPPW